MDEWRASISVKVRLVATVDIYFLLLDFKKLGEQLADKTSLDC